MNKIKQLRDFDSYYEMVDYFNDEAKCVKYLATLRWNGVITCPYCAHEICYELTGKNKRFKCAKCRKQFSVRVGTIFEDSKVPLRKWFFATYLFTAHKKGISSHQLARDLKVTQKTAWFMLQRIRESFSFDEPSIFSKTVEIDETFVGGKESNKHASKKSKSKYGKRVHTQAPVIGILERGGKVYAVPVKNTKMEHMYPVIASKVKRGTQIFTDDFGGYNILKVDYPHDVVNHSVKEEKSTQGVRYTRMGLRTFGACLKEAFWVSTIMLARSIFIDMSASSHLGLTIGK